MMDVNLKPSQRMAVVGAVNPQSASTAQDTGWFPIAAYANYLGILQVGALGSSATVDCKFQQAQDSSGTGAKDVTGKAVTQLTKAGSNDNGQCLINVKCDDFDFVNGFGYAKMIITPGTAASLIAGLVLGMDNNYDPPTQATSVEQTVL